MENIFYVYEWFNIETNEVFYVGKGCGKRYLEKEKRNKYFLEYAKKNQVDVRIVKNNLSEEEAFKQEKILTDYYKDKGECSCNLAEAGKGGCHFVWTEEMRQYWSEYNPMKEEKQRERMRQNNPMKDKEIAAKNGKKHKRAIFIGDKLFEGIVDASKYYNKTISAIGDWLRRGQTPSGEKCGYQDGGNPRESSHGRAVLVDGIFYPSVAAAARNVGIAPNNLRNALNNNKHICKGHSCEYVNQQPSQ